MWLTEQEESGKVMLRKALKNVQRPFIDFASLKKSRKPNTYLVAPKELTPYSPAEESPVFGVDSDELSKAFETIALSQPNTEKLSETGAGDDLQMEFVQYSKFIGFPDTITIRFMNVGDGRSTLAIYSRSHYGYRDFGVNRKRVQSWMKSLTEQLKD